MINELKKHKNCRV